MQKSAIHFDQAASETDQATIAWLIDQRNHLRRNTAAQAGVEVARDRKDYICPGQIGFLSSSGYTRPAGFRQILREISGDAASSDSSQRVEKDL